MRAYVAAQGWQLVAEHEDVASGKDDRRPGFQAALTRCRQLGAVLVAARLDRITRRAHALSLLLEEGVAIRAADMPGADELMLRIYAAIAQKERELISARTKAALAAAKARGTIWAATAAGGLCRVLTQPEPALHAEVPHSGQHTGFCSRSRDCGARASLAKLGSHGRSMRREFCRLQDKALGPTRPSLGSWPDVLAPPPRRGNIYPGSVSAQRNSVDDGNARWAGCRTGWLPRRVDWVSLDRSIRPWRGRRLCLPRERRNRLAS